MTEQRTTFRLLVFATAFCCLMFELILSRVADFHIDFRNSYLALPITFLGLAMGSFHVHFRPALIDRFDARRALWTLAGISFVTIFLMFLMFTQVFGVPAAEGFSNFIPLLVGKTLIFVAVFIAPFYYFGRLLTIAYHLNRDQIGLIYSADFFGAALACFATPVLFHFVSLPAVITALVATLSLLVWLFSRVKLGARALLALALVALNLGFYQVIAKMEGSIEFLYHAAEKNPPKLTEVMSKWNEFSRVQLVRFEPASGGKPYYKIIHDNARSNVHVEAYTPGKTAQAKRLDALELPFLLGREPKDVLVMFAGCGAEMVRINEYAGGKADITGVEINRACKEVALAAPELAEYKLAEFYDLPNIHLEIAEGRSFLEQSKKQYDMIFVGSSAPTALAFTGDTRKYMYTEEAMRAYLRALKPDGLLLFDHQPTGTTISTLRDLYEHEGRKDFEKSLMVIRSNFGRPSGSGDLIFSPAGFTESDIATVLKASPQAEKMLIYAPGYAKNRKDIVARVNDPAPLDDRVVDDRPYLLRLHFEDYRLWPTPEQFKDFNYYTSWMRATTLLVLCAVAGISILITASAPGRRLPPSVLLYLLLTGFCFLVVEIVLIAKLELFLQEPLISMACVVSVLLIASGIGSATYERVALRMGVASFSLLAAVVVLIDFKLLSVVITWGMHLPLLLRVILAIVMIVPVGVILGMFYPCAVNALVRSGRESSVPLTYGISTMASVIGAAYAMNMMILIGFTALIWQAVCVYLLLGGLLFIWRSVRGERSLF